MLKSPFILNSFQTLALVSELNAKVLVCVLLFILLSLFNAEESNCHPSRTPAAK